MAAHAVTAPAPDLTAVVPLGPLGPLHREQPYQVVAPVPELPGDVGADDIDEPPLDQPSDHRLRTYPVDIEQRREHPGGERPGPGHRQQPAATPTAPSAPPGSAPPAALNRWG